MAKGVSLIGKRATIKLNGQEFKVKVLDTDGYGSFQIQYEINGEIDIVARQCLRFPKTVAQKRQEAARRARFR